MIEDQAATPRQGLGNPLPIETLPPLPELRQDIPISESTGQPRRHPLMVLGISFLYAASVASAVAYAISWWDAIHVAGFRDSARLLQLTDPRPGSWQSVVWVTVLALIAVVMVAAPGIAGFNAWNGHRWSRWAALGAVVVGGLGYLLNQWAWVAAPLSLIGALVLWLPAVGRYFAHWARFRSGIPLTPTQWQDVQYGRLPRYQEDE